MSGGDRWHAGSGLWPLISAGAGGLLGGLGAWVAGFEPRQIYWFGLAGAYACVIPGTAAIWFWKLRQVALRGAESIRPVDLWDPWLDRDGVLHLGDGPNPDEVVPEFAPVRPRVVSALGDSFRLEDEIYPYLKGDPRGAIRIDGPIGSGKSTALRHLLATLPAELNVRALDGPEPETLAERAASGVVVYAADAPASSKHLATFVLTPWDEDEWIEYLLAVAPERCGSVMTRLKSADDKFLAEGSPELWRVALDEMIANDWVAGVRQALRLEIASKLDDPDLRQRVGDFCLRRLNSTVLATDEAEQESWRARDETLHRLIRHPSIRLLVAADRVVDDLANPNAACDFLGRPLPRDLIREAGLLIHDRPEIAARLVTIFAENVAPIQPMVASLLHAADLRWRPTQGSSPWLAAAYLDRVDWLAIALPFAQMIRVDLRGAGLCKATLDNASLGWAHLGRARLTHASLLGVMANAADLREADLTSARADGANFTEADLSQARLESASLRNVSFQRAKLAAASFKGADLTGATLESAIIDGADFSGATLESANLAKLDLSKASFVGVSFAGANLEGANLEGMALSKARFAAAKLADALLTGSVMPGADFRKADLRNAGLAEVSWEGACLAGADLRGASFHLGSSRSGLVNSPIASEGSKTGFYTDDLNEQDFKAPEEIRKADLRGVDLRGANLEGVDFYLVDLRGATFDPKQAHHLRCSGAILSDRRG